MAWQKRIEKFMRGRYGMDDLNNFLLMVYIGIFLIEIFINNKWTNIIEILIILIIFYRFLSKNIYQRNKENQKYLEIKNNMIRPFKNWYRNFKDKEHVYKKCSKCQTTLKLPLPSRRGFQKAKCPKCKNRVKLFTLKKEKIEIIKKR